MRVFLLHGLARTPASMWVLGQRLARAGHLPVHFGYSVTRNRLPEIVDLFVQRVEATLNSPDEPFAVVGHSLGNIITRLAAPRLPPGFKRFVMLAPPNRSPVLARRLRSNPMFRLLARDTGQSLADEAFYEQIPVPRVDSLIVAGTRGPRSPWLPFAGAQNDSVVGLEETFLDDVPVVAVHAMHTFLMNRTDVFSLVNGFLDRGSEVLGPAEPAAADAS